ncbi:MAG: zinc ribbon domain-containing protein [Gordonia sp. (in: high G+C Gram-positive bacteria)]
MSGPIEFTDYYSDHSTRNGYQWEFRCGRCNSTYRSSFDPDHYSRFQGLVHGVSNLVGGNSYRVASAADSVSGFFTGGGGASAKKDRAFAKAVDEVRPRFQHCGGCGCWVCERCWNPTAGLCLRDAPPMEHGLARSQAQVRDSQIREAVAEHNWVGNANVSAPMVARCPSCGTQAPGGGNFCGACGSSLQAPSGGTCRSCAQPLAPGSVFCTHCGTSSA